MYQTYKGGKIECNKWNEDSCKMGVRQYMSEDACMDQTSKNFDNIVNCRYSAEMQDDGNFVIYVSFDFFKFFIIEIIEIFFKDFLNFKQF
jgi:hypothetical protein